MRKAFSLNLLFCLAVALVIFACKKESSPLPVTPPVIPPVTPPAETRVFYPLIQFAMGVDLSFTNQIQDNGGVYKDSGVVKDPFEIFKAHGANIVRVRLWHNPQWQAPYTAGKLYSNLPDVEKTVGRAKAAGMAVSLDIHYSDIWADVGHQQIPAAWRGLPFNVLSDSVYQYTMQVLLYLKSKNLTPEMVQIGNETNQGMLFDSGKVVNNNFSAFGKLLNSGIKAVRDFSLNSSIKPLVILHVAQLENADYFANGVITSGGVSDFDILGVSQYYVYSSLATVGDVGTVIRTLKSKYNKKVMIVETAYPWTSQSNDSYNNIISGTSGFSGYDVSQAGQYNYLKDLTQQVISAGGSGIMYWAPDWITSSMKDPYGTGSPWENNAFFDFSANALPAIDYMTFAYQF